MKCAQGPTYLFIKTQFTNTMQLKTHSLHHFKVYTTLPCEKARKQHRDSRSSLPISHLNTAWKATSSYPVIDPHLSGCPGP